MMKDKQPLRLSLAAALLAKGQSLRADESVSATTMRLPYAAKWAEAVRS